MSMEQDRSLSCPSPEPADRPAEDTPCTTATPNDGEQSAERPAPPTLEAVRAAFPKLELIRFIGEGGMGLVYEARQPGLDRSVALKILRQSLTADPAFAERFSREARVMARLNHPQIVGVYDCGQAGGFYYLLMEFVDGVNLRQAMQAGRLSSGKALSIVSSVCEALQFAHDAGVVHRDIKPENILLDTRGRVKIADFGIARLFGDARQNLTVTTVNMALGTPQYMAPEQFQHPHDVDQAADIYSLGVVFYEMLTGELPIGRFPPPSHKSATDPRIDAVVLHTLELDPAKRYRNALDLKASVEAIVAEPSGFAAPANRPKRPLWSTVSAWVFIAIGLFAVLDTLSSLYSRPISPAVSPGLAHLFAGVALLTLSRRWRWAALIALALATAAAVLVTVMMAVAPERAAVMLPGSGWRVPVVERPRWAAAAAIAVAMLLVWPACTLLSRNARAMFTAHHGK